MTDSDKPAAASAKRPPVLIYDTTLRDGSQGEGVNFALEDKIRLAHTLDDLGIQYIEGGWPGSNPKDVDFFTAMQNERLKRAKLVAFGSTRRAGIAAGRDDNLKNILAARPDAACIVGKTWDLHVKDALRVTPEENLDMIRSSIAYLKKRLAEVFFDAEHFFDSFRRNPDFAMSALDAAVRAGADAVVLCDTNGGSLVHEVQNAVRAVMERFPKTLVGVHCHNDGGMAVANSVEAVLSGAGLVQGCMNGFGERTGNADLCTVIPVLELRCGRRCIGPAKLKRLTTTSRFVYELANLQRRSYQPFVGDSAFAHKGGLHVSAMARNDTTYEAFAPEAVGNIRRILISELAGRASVIARYPALKNRPDALKEVLVQVMRLENDGYAFENADASFNLMVKRILGVWEPSFELLGFRASTEERIAGIPISESSVKIRIGDLEMHTVSEARHGPVAAMDLALRKALSPVFPFVTALRLVDYRVHIVNAQAAAEARVRVVIQSRVGRDTWGTVGVSDNILHASCQAVVDSFQYLIMRKKKKMAGAARDMTM